MELEEIRTSEDFFLSNRGDESQLVKHLRKGVEFGRILDKKTYPFR